MPKVGDKITVLVNGSLVHCVLEKRVEPMNDVWNVSTHETYSHREMVALATDLKGITWCRGWSGKAVDALRAATALADPPRKNGMVAGFVAAYNKLNPQQKLALTTAASALVASALGYSAKPTAHKT